MAVRATPRLPGPSVLALVGDMNGPTLWRVLWPITALQQRGYACQWDRKAAAAVQLAGPSFDAYLLPRMAWYGWQRAVAASWLADIRAAGKLLFYDVDDDVFSPGYTYREIAMEQTEGRSFAELEQRRAERIWALRHADGVTVSTEPLAEVVRGYTERPVIVVPNAIDVHWFRQLVRTHQRQDRSCTVGWAGGERPDRDLAAVAEAWARLAASRPDVRFCVQGYQAPSLVAAVPEDRLLALPWMPLQRYPAGLAEVDVACCSVAGGPFDLCKSPIKAYEAALAGAAVVASPAVYGEILEHGKTGYLSRTADEWEAALLALVDSPSRRRMVARRLERVVERRCSLSENLWRWPAAWSAIAEDARSRRGRLVAV